MDNTVRIYDNLQDKILRVHPNRAKNWIEHYSNRFSAVSHSEYLKGVSDMARLAAKSPILFQKKLTLEEVKDEEMICVGLEEKEGTSGTYFLLRVKRANGETGYISMGFTPICDALRKLDPKKDLPGEIRFTKSGGSWLME